MVFSEQQINDCIDWDENIQLLRFRISELLTKQNKDKFSFNSFDRMELADKRNKLLKAELTFGSKNCRDAIEYRRLVDAGKISQDAAIVSEKEVFAQNRKEQFFYIGLATFVVISGLTLLLRK